MHRVDMTKLGKLPREGTKDRAKLEAMRRLGSPRGASQRELNDIDAYNYDWELTRMTERATRKC
jgi:hypothetical protein